MNKVFNAILVGLGATAIGAGVGAAGIALALLLALIKPLLLIFVGWAVGHGVAYVAGAYTASALSLLFHTTITPAALPMFFSALALVGGYLRPAIHKDGTTINVPTKKK